MKKWSVGVNDFYYTSSILLEEAPWYVFFLENLVSWICCYFPRIPLINFIKITVDGEKIGLRDYYGTTKDLFHCFICMKVTDWAWKKINHNSINLPYEKLMKLYPEEFKGEYEVEDEDERRLLNQNYLYSKAIGKIFENAYAKLSNISTFRMKQIKSEGVITTNDKDVYS